MSESILCRGCGQLIRVRADDPALKIRCPDCGVVVFTYADHEAGCKLLPKLLFDLGIQLRPEAPSGRYFFARAW